MKKIVLGLMVALMAASVATSAYAHNGADGERGGGGWRQWLKAGVHLGIGSRHDKDDTDDRDDDDNGSKEDEKKAKKQGVFGECGLSARQDLNASMKAAFSVFKTSKKTAHDVRVEAIVAAKGDVSKITSAWVEFQASFLSAWGTYTTAVTGAMKDYGIAFAKCKVTLTPTPSPTASASPTPTASPLVTYSQATVETHDTSASCWVVISGKVYNLTNFIRKHPGGSAAIKGLCGTDATAAFNAQHSGDTQPATTLSLYLIGSLQ